jgi:hypothetical protein
MSDDNNKETDGDRLRRKFSTMKSNTGMMKAEFARTFKIPGGASMISQHISGHRPISLEAAAAYATGFNCSIAEISPSLAALIFQHAGSHPGSASQHPAALIAVHESSSSTSFEDALRIVAVTLSQADQSDRNAAKAYLTELCEKPENVDTFAEKLKRILTPLPLKANSKLN